MKKRYYLLESLCFSMVAIMIAMVSCNIKFVNKIPSQRPQVQNTFLKGDEFMRFASIQQGTAATNRCLQKSVENNNTVNRMLYYLAEGLMERVRNIVKSNVDVSTLQILEPSRKCCHQKVMLVNCSKA